MIVRDMGVSYFEVERLGIYKKRLLMGYKEPEAPQSQEAVDAEMNAQFQQFTSIPRVRRSMLKGK